MAQHEYSSDEATPLDALVGGFEDCRKEAPTAEDPAVFRVPVFVIGVADAGGMGLADEVIPAGGTSTLLTLPIDRTLLKEQHDSRVFLIDGQKLRLVKSQAVMEARCLPWRHVRVVPDGALSTLPQGPDLDLP